MCKAPPQSGQSEWRVRAPPSVTGGEPWAALLPAALLSHWCVKCCLARCPPGATSPESFSLLRVLACWFCLLLESCLANNRSPVPASIRHEWFISVTFFSTLYIRVNIHYLVLLTVLVCQISKSSCWISLFNDYAWIRFLCLKRRQR